jgi:hypothetical protein
MGKDNNKTIKDRTEKYGRYLAEVYINIDDIEVNINDLSDRRDWQSTKITKK